MHCAEGKEIADRIPFYGVGRLRRAAIHFLAGRIIQAVARMALLLILVRLLSVHEFGIYMVVAGVSEMILQLASCGILPVGRRFIPAVLGKVPKAHLEKFVLLLVSCQWLALAAVTAIAYSIFIAFAPWSALDARQEQAVVIGICLLFLVPAVRFSCELMESILAHGRSRTVAAAMVVGRLAGIAFMLLSGITIDLYTVLVMDVIVSAASLILAQFLLLRSFRGVPDGDATGALPVRDMIRFGWHMAAVDFMGSSASPGAVRLALAGVLGAAEGGLFAFLQSMQRLVGRYMPGVLLRGLMMPALLARSHLAGGRELVSSGAGLLIKIDLSLIAVGAIVIAIAGDELVLALSGGKFHDAGFTLLLMYLMLAVLSQRSVTEMVMQITGQTAALRMTALFSPLALVVIWFFAAFGLDAAIAVHIAVMTCGNAIAVSRLVFSADGFRVDWRGQGVVYAALAAGVALGMAMRSFPLPLVPATLCGLAVFLLVLLVFKPFNERERVLVEKTFGDGLVTAIVRRLCREPVRLKTG